ncbi:MAG: hypothetical protein INR65_03245 [Gluconacetobacter diazotrophicus]|nr:hypothetical protein [Gluconacetobacter diazotrophicus]
MGLKLTLLGNGSVAHLHGTRVALPANAWPLLGYLLALPVREAHRDLLAETLWPDHDRSAARHCLATVLWRIKTAFGRRCTPLAVTCEQVAFAPPPGIRVWVDTIAFDRRLRPLLDRPDASLDLVACRRLRRALAAYRGDFLPETGAEWAMLERERLRAVWLDALYALARAFARLDDWCAAIALARTLCAAEPLREDAHRLLMAAYARGGNRALALRQFRVCAQVLSRELGIEPMEQTVALHRSLSARLVHLSDRPLEQRELLVCAWESMRAALRAIETVIAEP